MIPHELYRDKKRIVGNGNVIRRSKVIRRELEDAFGLTITLTEAAEEAAQGAALLAAHN